jgi:hypothetical protein
VALQVAVDAMQTKNRDLINLIEKHVRGSTEGLNTFTMVLNGVIDAAVSGGVENYRKIFFCDDFIRENRGTRFSQVNQCRLTRDDCRQETAAAAATGRAAAAAADFGESVANS